MGEIPCTNLMNPDTTTCSVVAPYVADIDTEIAGIVRYTDFNTYSSSDSSMSTVSAFVRDETGDSFYGSRMMVAEWNGVAESGGSSVSVISIKLRCIFWNDGYAMTSASVVIHSQLLTPSKAS